MDGKTTESIYSGLLVKINQQMSGLEKKVQEQKSREEQERWVNDQKPIHINKTLFQIEKNPRRNGKGETQKRRGGTQNKRRRGKQKEAGRNWGQEEAWRRGQTKTSKFQYFFLIIIDGWLIWPFWWFRNKKTAITLTKSLK